MSIEAMAYVKSRDFGDCESARLLLITIAENTFNDSRICVVGSEQLAYDIRKSERTVRRQLDALVAARIILRKARYPDAGGRLNDALRLRGFSAWLLANSGASRRAHKARTRAERNVAADGLPLPDILSGTPPPLADKMSGRASGQQMSGVTGQQVSGTLEARNYPVNRKSAGASAPAPSADFNFDLEGKAVRDRLHHRLGAKFHDSWFAGMAFSPGDGGTAIAAAADKFVCNWVRDKFAAAVLAAAKEVWPETQRVEFRADPALAKRRAAA